MSRTPIPFHADDISAISRSLTRQLSELDHLPGHLEMLNLLARAIGFRNFQALRAHHEALNQLSMPVPAPPPVDFAHVARLRRYFDSDGRLTRWPSKHSHRLSCLWVVWSRLPHHKTVSERQINAAIQEAETIGDHVLLRREMVDQGLLARTPDGREYRRVEHKPPADVEALLRHVGA